MSTATVSPTGLAWRVSRATAPMTRVLAGRRFFPWWAVVQHTGRISGRPLRVPVAITETVDGLLINLPWGPRTNWVRNVVATGGCTVRWKGRDLPCGAPQFLDGPAAEHYLSPAARLVARRVFGGHSFLLLRPLPIS